MTLKEIVEKIESIKGVSCHVGGDIITLANKGPQGYNAKFFVEELTNITEITTPLNEKGVQIDLVGPKRLFVSTSDFAFTTRYHSKVFVKELLQVISLKEALDALSKFESAKRTGNLDELMGLFYFTYAALESASEFIIGLNNDISKFYDLSKDLYFFERENLPLFTGVYLGNRGLELPKLKVENSYGIEDFINYWKKLYSYKFEFLYKSIYNKQLDRSDIIKLYGWKNGTWKDDDKNLSAKKLKSLETKIISKLDIINKLKQEEEFDIDYFFKEFENVSTVWKVFLLHIIKPTIYPIYDQHIHRAYLYINRLDYKNINANMSDRKKLDFYLNEYLPFVKRMNITDLKAMDEAFFAFGQFLNIGHQKLLF